MADLNLSPTFASKDEEVSWLYGKLIQAQRRVVFEEELRSFQADLTEAQMNERRCLKDRLKEMQSDMENLRRMMAELISIQWGGLKERLEVASRASLSLDATFHERFALGKGELSTTEGKGE